MELHISRLLDYCTIKGVHVVQFLVHFKSVIKVALSILKHISHTYPPTTNHGTEEKYSATDSQALC